MELIREQCEIRVCSCVASNKMFIWLQLSSFYIALEIASVAQVLTWVAFANEVCDGKGAVL